MLDYSTFYHIIKTLVNKESISPVIFQSLTSKDWQELYELSIIQGLTAITYTQLKPIFEKVNISIELQRTWRVHSLTINNKMEIMNKTCAEFAEKMFEKNIPIVALKGVAYASYYPDSNIRECGDLDCYMFDKKNEGDLVISEIGGSMKEAGAKHSHLFFKGITIENHKYFTSFSNTEQGRSTEMMLEHLLNRGCEYLVNTKLLNPNPDFTSVFMMKHAQRHFLYEGIRMRHLLDWAFFLKAEYSRINWDTILRIMDQCRLLNFTRLMTNVCVKELGLDVREDMLIKLPDELEKLRMRFLKDIMGDQPAIQNTNILKKTLRILRRIYRMWIYRSIADENYLKMVWNVFAYSSLWNKRLKM